MSGIESLRKRVFRLDSIAKRLAFAFAALGLVLAGSVAFSLVSVSSLGANVDMLAKVRAPTAEAGRTMLAGVNRSLAALRGWMLLKEPRFRKQRQMAWVEEIDPALDSLSRLSVDWTVAENRARLGRVRTALAELSRTQIEIENIAHSPENFPATRFFEEDANPLLYRMQRDVQGLLEEMDSRASERSGVRSSAEKLYAALASATAALREHVLDGSVVSRKEFETHWADARAALASIRNAGGAKSGAYARLVASLVRTDEELAPVVARVFEVRSRDGWDVARHLLRERAAPAAQEIQEDLRSMVANQTSLFSTDLKRVESAIRTMQQGQIGLLALGLLLAAAFAVGAVRAVTRHLGVTLAFAADIADGKLDKPFSLSGASEVENLGRSLERMRISLQRADRVARLRTGLSETMRGDLRLEELCQHVVQFLARHCHADVGTFYVADETGRFRLQASYAFEWRKSMNTEFQLGEGLAGQAALEDQLIILQDVPADYIRVVSTLGDSVPTNIVALPLGVDGRVLGVLELGSLAPLSSGWVEHLKLIAEDIGIAVRSSQLRTEIAMKQESLEQNEEELKTANEELSASNEELEEHTQRLKQSEEELQATNEELEERAEQVTQQKEAVEAKQAEAEAAQLELQAKAEQLALTSKYKSEFLANMSHELRTPLNSLLILAKLLGDNKPGNLTDKQIEYASTIHESGSDLLSLINEILDLAKIESGTMDVELADVPLAKLRAHLENTFRATAETKELKFHIDVGDSVPERIRTDRDRFQQVLRNLVANALKFTEAGAVAVRFTAKSMELAPGTGPVSCLEVSVVDTGVGIPEEKQSLVFEAFQQADSSETRRFGGTGLGLSISREIAKLLGGELRLESKLGEGSTFSFVVPVDGPNPTTPAVKAMAAPSATESARTSNVPPTSTAPQGSPLPSPAFPDDRHAIRSGDRVLLIVEDDVAYAKLLADVAREHGFRAVISHLGVGALGLAKKYRPHAVTLDLRLPDCDGWVVLDQLKHDSETRHIPVHILSAQEPPVERGLRVGAVACVSKPSDPEKLSKVIAEVAGSLEDRVKRLLVIEDDAHQREALTELVDGHDVEVLSAASGEAALQILETTTVDCIALDLGLPEMNGFEFLENIRDREGMRRIPVVVYTARDLTREEEQNLSALTEAIVIKDARSPERLLDETALFLHRVESQLAPEKRQVLQDLRQRVALLEGKKILVVDDDPRNVFALTSMLEDHGTAILRAENGREALDVLDSNPDVDLVLMDIMMPEMDGYEAMRRLRADPRFEKLPVLALTAKAMKEDRQRCLDAGASDYISKPLDSGQLLSLLRVWLCR